ncbi:MAG: carbamoyltransferase HypF [Oligoflexia bacterium]|nr:carbamoyltransferase HypF [Oligoflexia bacterium]
MKNSVRKKITIKGTVQGVGFRPTVYRYATGLGLTGFVLNTTDGLIIEVQGDDDSIGIFTDRLKKQPPENAVIESFHVHDTLTRPDSTFIIKESINSGFYKEAEIAPDIAVCRDCLNDISDKNNKRYMYPFTNCTNCGPRFSIIKDRPYDRANTSMYNFTMCDSCLAEYTDPGNRRFHAQPNACPECGPVLYFLNHTMKNKNPSALFEETAELIRKGMIVGIKGLGGFNIACTPDIDTVDRLRRIKKRPGKSFALMARDLPVIEKFCFAGELEKNLLLSKTAPIVLLKKKNDLLDHISPDNNYLGFMLPYSPMHYLLMNYFDVLVFTSANKKDEPICINDSEINKLIDEKIIDAALSNNREIVNRADDSIVQVVNGRVQTIRKSRGMIPSAFATQITGKSESLAMGANLKNTFSLRKNEKIYMSQHIGDLMDYRNLKYQKQQVAINSELLGIYPEKINIDAHPGYENFNETYGKVFHHHAHALSVMGEHGLLGQDVLGIICDGTGYGTDGRIWGFEFLKIGRDYNNFSRTGQLEYFKLPGGEKAIHETDRIGISLCRQSGIYPDIFAKNRIEDVRKLIDNNINSPECSSLGRLFDGIASILGIADIADYEAKAAILLQREAENAHDVKQSYSVNLDISGSGYITIRHSTLIKEIINELHLYDKSVIARKFHAWVVSAIMQAISIIGPERVVFSGGCFQNKLLCEMLFDNIKGTGIDFYFNENVPVNDAGISYGQALL